MNLNNKIIQLEEKLQDTRDEYKEARDIIAKMKIIEIGYIEEIAVLKKHVASLEEMLQNERIEFKETYSKMKQNLEDFINVNNELKNENLSLMSQISQFDEDIKR